MSVLGLVKGALEEVAGNTLDELPGVAEAIGELIAEAIKADLMDEGPDKEVQGELVLAKAQMVYEALARMGDEITDPKVLVRVLLLGLKLAV